MKKKLVCVVHFLANLMPGSALRRAAVSLSGGLLLAMSVFALPFEVSTLADLQKVGSGIDGWTLGATYSLMTNIDASATTGWNSGAGFQPVGTYEAAFTGAFNGNGHVISGLTINRPDQSNVGLFGYVGAGGVVSNLCLIGAAINGDWEVGGVAGMCEGLLTCCSVSGSVSGSGDVGGVAGSIYGGGVERCYASGSVEGSYDIGGLVGYSESGSVGESYSSVVVSGEEATGGLVGNGSGSVVVDSYWDTQTSGQSSSPGGGTGKTTAQMKQKTTFSGWNFTNTWGIVETASYPYLRTLAINGNAFILTVSVRGPGSVTVAPQLATYMPGTNVTLTAQASAGIAEFVGWLGGIATPTNTTASLAMDGHKSITAVFRSARSISSISELQKIGNDAGYTLDGRYWLAQNLFAAETVDWNSGAGFQPIGSASSPFTGRFDGRTNLIARLTIARASEDNVGLFGYIGAGAEIKNLGLAYANISGSDGVGALIGRNAGGLVERCFAEADVSGVYNDVGALIGQNAGGTSRACYALGSVSGQSNVGGLVGLNNSGGTVTQTFAACAVTATSSNAGGLVGGGDGTAAVSFWDMEMSGQTSSSGGDGKTTAQLWKQTTFMNWNFDEVWNITENADYPYLRGFVYTYTVFFNAQGGIVAPPSATVPFGGMYGELSIPERTGYVFKGWWTGTDGRGSSITNTSFLPVASNQTVYAKWVSDAFTVKGAGTDAIPVGVTNAVQVATNNFGDGGTSVRLGGVGILGDNQMAGIEWSVKGQGILAFFLRVSSESGYDWLRFYEVGGATTNQISGTKVTTWTNLSVTVTGAWDTVHTFRWEYIKDSADYVEPDCGWVDAIRWTPFYALTVANGTGDGAYTNGTVVAITSDAPPAHQIFHHWVGDTNTVSDVYAATALLVMPATNTLVTATYTPILYALAVSHGAGSGAYPYGSTVEIIALQVEDKQFYRWTGDVATVAHVLAATTTVVTTDVTLSVAATYSVQLSVTNGSGSGWYPEGSTVTVTANTAPPLQDFSHWGGNDASLLVNASAASTTIILPTHTANVVAVFSNTLSRAAGCYGRTLTSSGITSGISTDFSTLSPASGTPTVKLGGPGVVPDNGFAAFETSVFGSGTVSFWWKVSSEGDADFLRFLVDTVEIAAISGTKGPGAQFTQFTHTVTGSGVSHVLRWEYVKDGASASNLDAGWVDDIIWVGDVAEPVLSPDIYAATVANNVFSCNFWGERGIPYIVQTNATLETGGWTGTAAVPQYDSETNGIHRFSAGVPLPLDARTGFFRIKAGTQ